MTTSNEVLAAGPLCGEAEFSELIDQMVAENAPRVFAVVQELGDRIDGWIAAWGMEFEDRVEVIDADGGLRMTLQAPETALRGYRWGGCVSARLVWLDVVARKV